MPQKMKNCPNCGEEIPATARECKHCKSDVRNWFARHKFLTGLMIFVVIGIIGNLSGMTDKSLEEARAKKEQEEIQEQEAEASKAWTSVFEVSANSDKQTESFNLEGGKQKIVYKTTGGEYTICSIYLLEEGDSLDRGGGFPEVMIDGSQEDETMMRKNKGQYYVDIKVANGNCQVEIQELR